MINTRKYNIAILSDSPFLTTGYSDQSKILANTLVENGHNVTFYAHTYTGQNILPPVTFEDGRQLKFRIVGQGRAPYFQDLLPIYLKQDKIEIFIILLDTFMLFDWILRTDLSPAKTVFWFPSDGGGGMPLGCEEILKRIHAPIAMAKFGQEQCRKMHGLNVGYIPHAIEIANYYPLSPEKRKELRQKWGIDDKFVIGVVARNQGRKMLDRTIKVMAEYAKLNPDAILLMHCDPQDPAQVFPIDALIKRYKIENRVLFTGTKYFKGYNYKDMVDVYGMMDVFLLTTSGEGFGIPLIEAEACGVPVLATDYTTTRELVIEPYAGLGINLVGTTEEENPNVHCEEVIDGTLTGSWAVERGICSIKDAVKKLDYLFKNPEERIKMGKNGINNVRVNYNWEVVGKQWLELVNKLGSLY